MKPVDRIQGTMVPIGRADVDTDQIIPQRFLKRVERTGYGDFLFHNWAHADDGTPIVEFVTNRVERAGARVLVAGPNFGCGSSREHAAWAIQDWGFEAVIAPSTADIFKANAANIGLLVIEMEERHVAELLRLADDPTVEISIDLSAQTVTAPGVEITFDIDSTTKDRLLGGLDRIGATLDHDEAIARHEALQPTWMPTTT